ncbi:hypothetical protein MHBO_005097 [Bonamia ostreae]|uniref:Uncharacterized protein n=1 Tax=Bonamia ostreae TaxID=126728 RepID=A0ABV2AV30_9EUKA
MNEECDHEMLMNDLCVQCGKDLSGLSFKQSENGESKRKSTKKDKLFSVVLGKNKKLFFSKDVFSQILRKSKKRFGRTRSRCSN